MSIPTSSDETIFAGALERSGAERTAFLDQACAGDPERRARIESLLRAHESAQAQFLATATTPPRIVEPSSGEMIGRYKILQKLGEGGCGTVYMAEQEVPVRRRVALKVIKLGMDTKEVIARFEAERQALALMDHPNIARVLDAGATDTGRPFFVMELVRGVKVTEYCDQNNLSTAARFELFTDICHAVQHAHQKGVIHRDIKPSNILVTLHDGDPVPKVIDFGIAKATAGRLTDNTLFTAFEQFIGTPAYMSPEQAEMSGFDIDTRSDIYSLGVLLYELLTGRTPFDASELLKAGLDTMRRHIREVDPPKPSTRVGTIQGEALVTTAKQRQIAAPKLVGLLQGDLDWIVMKALEKKRARRYETATALADDIGRHLHNEPVTACPPSAAYRLSKMVRRNQLAFVAGGAIAAALVVGLGFSTWMFFREKAAREHAVAAEREQALQRTHAETARTQEAQQRKVAEQAQSHAEAAKAEESRQRTLADNARLLAEENKKKAQDEAAISKAVSEFLTDDLLRQVDSTAQAGSGTAPNPDLKVRDALDRASERVGPRFQNQPLTEAAVRAAIAAAYQAVGVYAKAVVHYERALELRKAALGPEHRGTLELMSNLAAAYHSQGRRAEAAAFGAETLEIQRRVLGPEHHLVLATMHNLANSYDRIDRQEDAASLRTQVLEINRRVRGPEHPTTLIAMISLAASHMLRGKFEEGAALTAQAWEIQKRVLGPEHPQALTSMINLATAQFNLGRQAEGIALFSRMLEIQTRLRGADHPSTLWSMSSLAAMYDAHGKRTEAAALRTQTLAAQSRVLGPEHPHTLETKSREAGAYLEQGRYAEAVALSAQTWETQKRVLGPEHRDTLGSMRILAAAYYAQSKLVEAAALYSEMLEIQRRVHDPEHAATLDTITNLARIYRAQGRNAEATKLQTELLEVQERVLGPKHVGTLTTLRTLAATKETGGELEEAETLMRTWLSRSPKPDDSPRTMLSSVLIKRQKFAEAEALMRPVQTLRDEMMPDAWQTFFSRSVLGGALAGQRKYAEAEPLLVSAGEGLLKRIATIAAVDKRRVKDALEQLVQFYTGWEKPEQAAEWQKKLDEWKAARPANAATDQPSAPATKI